MIKLTGYLAAVLMLLMLGYTVPFDAVLTGWPMVGVVLLTSGGIFVCGYAAGRAGRAAGDTAVSERRRAIRAQQQAQQRSGGASW